MGRRGRGRLMRLAGAPHDAVLRTEVADERPAVPAVVPEPLDRLPPRRYPGVARTGRRVGRGERAERSRRGRRGSGEVGTGEIATEISRQSDEGMRFVPADRQA